MPDTPYPVMMFAAGFGTRMQALTRDMPKPMIKVAGQPLIDHALGLVRAADVGPVVANLHYKPEMLERHLHPQNVQTVIEAPDILETGGGLRNALPLLGRGPVFTMNTDAIWAGPNPLRLLQDHWEPERMDALLMCIPPGSAVGHAGTGDFTLDAHGHLTRGSGQIYSGLQIIKTALLSEIKEKKFSLNLLWDRMLAKRRLFGLTYPGRWCDVGHPEGIILAENLLGQANV